MCTIRFGEWALQYDAAAAAKEEQRKKAQQLERYEAARQEKEAAKSPKPQSEFLTRLITRVISNLLVTVNDIHIRYEDTASDPQVRHRPSQAVTRGPDICGRLTATEKTAVGWAAASTRKRWASPWQASQSTPRTPNGKRHFWKKSARRSTRCATTNANV